MFSFLAYFGAACISLVVADVVFTIYKIFFAKGIPVKSYKGKAGWALVTGASDGIGKEFALQLAKQGFNLALLARSEDKLKSIAAEIEEKYSQRSLVIPFDCSTTNDDDYMKLGEILGSIEISVIVNNVGRSEELYCPFILSNLKTIGQLININISATMKITNLCLQNIIERHNADKQSRALILNIGSGTGICPMPYLATYSGTKACLSAWNEVLRTELKEHRIDCHIISPGLVATNMSNLRRSQMVPGPKEYVTKALDTIGVHVGSFMTGETSSWPSHALLLYGYCFMSRLPIIGKVFLNYILDSHLKQSKHVRERALFKRAKLEDSKKVY